MAQTWVPDACTLPTAQQPLRIAEFDDLFAARLRWERPGPTWLRVFLCGVEEPLVRDLLARESRCCTFFDFGLAPAEDGWVVDVRVPPAHMAVLDAIERRMS